MLSRRLAFAVTLCAGIWGLSLVGFQTLCAVAQSPDNASTPVQPADEMQPTTDNACAPFPDNATAAARTERPVFIKVPEAFASLDRAPVLFLHDKHALALKDEGCKACHGRQNGKFTFTFPEKRVEGDKNDYMDAFHDACISCHQKRLDAGQKAGPLNCGECHIDGDAFHRARYLPKMPEYYNVLRDTHHKNCIACHRDPAKSAEDAAGLDWKNFYVKEKARRSIAWPAVVFDYCIHSTHSKALEKKCELCHFLPPAVKAQRDAEGKDPTCQDWLKEVEKGKSLKVQEESHARCINCHLEKIDKKQKAGPIYCAQCHREIPRTAEQVKNAPRPECDQKDRFLIELKEGARMKAVAFDHKAHNSRTRSCQDCHHDTLEACRSCHTEKGDEKGKFITLAESFHEPGSKWSCVGCHEQQKKKPDCAGCHNLLPTGLVESACATCHSGSLGSLDNATQQEDPKSLFPDDLKDEVEAKLLEKEYEPSKFKHRDIVKQLTDISNNSKLATYFHTGQMTICQGCHHMGPLEKNKTMPACATCHTARTEPDGKTPALLGAYHQQCLGCHKQMNRPEDKMPQKCTGCHKEKQEAASGGEQKK